MDQRKRPIKDCVERGSDFVSKMVRVGLLACFNRSHKPKNATKKTTIAMARLMMDWLHLARASLEVSANVLRVLLQQRARECASSGGSFAHSIVSGVVVEARCFQRSRYVMRSIMTAMAKSMMASTVGARMERHGIVLFPKALAKKASKYVKRGRGGHVKSHLFRPKRFVMERTMIVMALSIISLAHRNH
jgi:hypothetical protein